eukprot:NP_494459.2 Uncharacterized protein CELE_T10D4.11 [Caenorhabditis elegans]
MKIKIFAFLVIFFSCFCMERLACQNQSCPCSNLYDNLNDAENTVYYEGLGCSRTVYCTVGYWTWLTLSWELSDIPTPSDIYEDTFFAFTWNHTDPMGVYAGGPITDLVSLLGMQCDRSTSQWIVTRYPFGYSYFNQNDEKIVIDGYSVEGVRSIVSSTDSRFSCANMCRCSDLMSLVEDSSENILYTFNGNHCSSNFTCNADSQTFIRSSFDGSEIPGIGNRTGAMLIPTIPEEDQPEHSSINIMVELGIYCHEGEWYVTQYPYGVTYMDDTGTKYITGEDWGGKKSKVLGFRW